MQTNKYVYVCFSVFVWPQKVSAGSLTLSRRSVSGLRLQKAGSRAVSSQRETYPYIVLLMFTSLSGLSSKKKDIIVRPQILVVLCCRQLVAK